ncbi:MAG TPA: MarR family transcriptional regulator [Thermoanaerobaculia bacterium]|nr:MarR family transcriptional regulator [Thermoanaerobaculia bacterium]
MAKRPPRDKATLAAEAWRLFFDFFLLTRPERDCALEALELTPNDARALGMLDPAHGRTMRSLAEAWGCDASNATCMIDRLEARGLAERRTDPDDRRVKHVVLTPAGVRTRAALIEAIYKPPPAFVELPRASLEALRDAAAKLPRQPAGPPPGEPERASPRRAQRRSQTG